MRVRDLNFKAMPGPGDLWRDPDDHAACPDCGGDLEECDCDYPEPDYEEMYYSRYRRWPR